MLRKENNKTIEKIAKTEVIFQDLMLQCNDLNLMETTATEEKTTILREIITEEYNKIKSYY
jgi:hypothetical protein